VPSQRIDVVYNAVPAPPLASPASPTFDIVSVGRLVPWKGFDDLIAIAGRRGWSLRIVGDGPLRASLEQQATAVGATVEFSGHVAQADVANAIRSGRVFALNSSYEGLPHIVLEAMAVGVPVIASAAGGTPETIEHGRTGLLVKVGDPAELEAALAQVLADDEWRALLVGRAGDALAQRFSFGTMVRDTRRVLETVAGQRSKR
jgi:glycosyltransferase involved in cell wall biosynthesis